MVRHKTTMESDKDPSQSRSLVGDGTQRRCYACVVYNSCYTHIPLFSKTIQYIKTTSRIHFSSTIDGLILVQLDLHYA